MLKATVPTPDKAVTDAIEIAETKSALWVQIILDGPAAESDGWPDRICTTESSFPIELAGVYSTIELDAAHFQLSSTQLDPIPEVFNVKRSIPVYSTKIE